MADKTAQIGRAGLGSSWLASGTSAVAPAPPIDPANFEWHVAENSGEPPAWRRTTIESFARGPVFPLPTLDPLTIPFYECDDFAQRVTPIWRYRTLESRAVPFFPSLIPSQQINLINQGINHRSIGTCTLTGGEQGLQAFISGVNQSGTFAALSCRITRQLGATGTCTVVFNVAAGGFTPAPGASIVIIENNVTLFSGLIIRRTYTVYPATTMTKWTCTGVDWNGLTQRHILALNVDASQLKDIVQQILLQPTIYQDGITPDAVEVGLPIDAFSWPYIKISDAFTQLAQATNTIWWVDNYKIMHQIHVANAVASVFSVTESGQQVDPEITVDDSLDNYRNVQYIRSTNDILNEAVTVTDSHTFSGAVADVVCITRYPFTSAPESVLENGIEIVNTNRFFKLNPSGPSDYPPGGEGWYWMVGSYGVWKWPANIPPVFGTTLSITYTGVSTYAGNVVKYQDSAQIAAMQAVSGGSGIFEEIEDYSGSLTYSQALQLAQGIEEATAPAPQVLKVSTVEYVEDIGYSVTVTLPRWGISGTYIIQQIDLTDMGADLGQGTRFRRTLQLVSARTLGNYAAYWERLFARLNKGQIITPTEKPTWDLAFDSPGNTSSGLATGSFGNPYAVQVGLGRILYVSAVFATPADADIVIDIFLNGTSIFSNAAKLTYTVGDTGNQVLYANLNPNQVNVTRGDQFILTVNQCGTLNPGKNGTITLVIGSR